MDRKQGIRIDAVGARDSHSASRELFLCGVQVALQKVEPEPLHGEVAMRTNTHKPFLFAAIK
jgi:hypothetical protein